MASSRPLGGAATAPPQRLCRRPLFLRVQAQGRRRRGRWLSLLYLGQPAGGPARVGLTVSGRVGPAVVRNRVKRRLRAIVRAAAGHLHPATDYVFVAHPSARVASYPQLAEEAEWLIKRAQVCSPG